MKTIAFLHYHLQPGGVTTVIRNAARALGGRYRIRLLTDFGYREDPYPNRAAFLRASRRMIRRLEPQLAGVDLLHTHNIGLGKHPVLTQAVRRLAESGRVQVHHQVHDFPEDNRPAQLRALRYCTGQRDDRFYRALCYYDLPAVTWSTLTTHDAARLASRGVPADRIRVLPNPIDDGFFRRPAPSTNALREIQRRLAAYAVTHRYRYEPARKLLLAPVKVMERKNNAEAVELVRRLNKRRDRYQLLISLDASSLRDRRYSESLKRRIRRDHLPVVIGFGYELDNPLPLFHLAHAVVTTSRVEGFGYTFVEGWLCHKLVVGRDIPAVTADFRAAGLDLAHLYRELDDDALTRVSRLLARRPRRRVEHNRRVVLREYSLRAYARRYARILNPAS